MTRNGPCAHDCGPRGHCQCGVCVLGKGDNCADPCEHCSQIRGKLSILQCLVLGSLVLAAFVATCRFRRRSRLCRLFIFLMLSIPLAMMVLLWARSLLEPELAILFSLMPEELNPSDHHALLATFSLI